MGLTEGWTVWAKGAAYGLGMATISVPSVLLTHYHKLGLNDTEAMFLLQLLTFRQLEQTDFPSLEQLEQRMGAGTEEIAAVVQRLIRDKWISIDEQTDEHTGIQYESYNLQGTYEKLAQILAEERMQLRKGQQKLGVNTQVESNERNLFVIFEKEFGRPLSPMECENISVWVDQDGYQEDLILLALKEAVFAGKVHFRYIDRILLEWSRNRVTTVEEARAYIRKFRNYTSGLS